MAPSSFLLRARNTLAPVFMPTAVPPMVAKALNGNHGGAGTPWAITIPATAQPGDLALVVVGAINLGGATRITPAGWTLLHSGLATAGFNNLSALYTKVLTAGDIGVPISFGSSSDKWNVGVRVYRDAAIDVSGFTVINNAGANIPQTSVLATRRGINVQMVTATGNLALNNWTRAAKASNFDFNLQFAPPAYAGQAHNDTMVYTPGATTTAVGIGRGGSSTAAGVVNYNVVLYRTSNLLTAVLDAFTRADTNVANSNLAGLGTSSDAKVSYFEHTLTAGGIFGINANQAYSQVSVGTSMVSVAEIGTPRMTLSVKVSSLPHASAQAGLAVRYSLLDHTGLALTVELSGVLRVFNIGTGADITPGGLPTVAAGDTIGAECNGTTITIYKNSVAVGSLTSTVNENSGLFGGVYLRGATQVQNNLRLDDLNIAGYFAPLPADGLPAADTFNRADSTVIGTASDGRTVWTETHGDWDILSNRVRVLTNPPGNPNAGILTFDAKARDIDMSVDMVQATTEFNGGFVLRWAGGHGYVVRTRGVHRYDAANPSSTQEVVWTPPAFVDPSRYRVTLIGSTVTLYMGLTVIGTHTLAVPTLNPTSTLFGLTGGAGGLPTQKSTFDNFSAIGPW